MKKLLLLLVPAALAGAIAVGPAGAVQGGTPDTANAYPYVGMSVFYKDGVPIQRCSGTLISPRVYVTAAHCSGVENGVAPDSAQIWFSPTSTPRGGYPGTGSCAGYTGFPCTGDVGGRPVAAPGWAGVIDPPNTHDIGVVVLDTPYAAPAYGTLAPLGYLDSLAKKRGQQNVNFTIVGYGVQFELPNVEVATRDRYVGVTQLTDLAGHQAGGSEVRMSASSGNGTGGGGACFGDSGGPVFHTSDSGVTYVVGDISWGKKYCNGTSAFFRTDTAEAQSFLAAFPH